MPPSIQQEALGRRLSSRAEVDPMGMNGPYAGCRRLAPASFRSGWSRPPRYHALVIRLMAARSRRCDADSTQGGVGRHPIRHAADRRTYPWVAS